MYEWTPERIEWYERAIDYTGYDRRLADEVEPFLLPSDTVCDLGCGTGYLALELARRGYTVSAVDMSAAAMDCLCEKPGVRETGIELVIADWADIRERRWDSVIMCLTGSFERELSYYLSLCRRQLIVIGKRRPQRYEGAMHPLVKNFHKYDELRDLLERSGAPFEYRQCAIEFGQPLRSEDEAREYLAYYGAAGETIKDSLGRLKETADSRYPLYLPYIKDMGICVIKKQLTY